MQKKKPKTILTKGVRFRFGLVELRGFEPLTYTLRTYRATNCAISPNFGGNKWARTIDLLHVKQAL